MGDRIILLVTLSALKYWSKASIDKGAYHGDIIHMDIIAVAGATVEQLLIAFLSEYG